MHNEPEKTTTSQPERRKLEGAKPREIKLNSTLSDFQRVGNTIVQHPQQQQQQCQVNARSSYAYFGAVSLRFMHLHQPNPEAALRRRGEVKSRGDDGFFALI